MASSLPSALPVVTKASSSSASHQHFAHHSKLYFHLSPKPKLLFVAKGSRTSWNNSVVAKAQVSNASVDGSSNAVPTPEAKSEVPELGGNDGSLVNETSAVPLSDASISEFMSQVADLVKLVDSRDIVELELKQSDCELIIRKKEALPQQQLQAPVIMMQPPPPQTVVPSHFPPPQTTAPAAPISSTPSSPTPTAPPSATLSNSSLPPLKCPMAGTFYRSPAPGEPPFVKVGDKVNKGQILCIIEAMKLMNEIEADRSGTILEILVDDGKSVSVDTPLFVIQT